MRFSDSQPPVLATLAASGVLPAGEGGRLAFDQNLYLMQLNPTFGIVTQPAHGVVSVNPDKSLTYTPDAPTAGQQPFVGWEEFTYSAHPQGMGVVQQRMRLTLAVPNVDPPPALPAAAEDQTPSHGYAGGPVSYAALDAAYEATKTTLKTLSEVVTFFGQGVETLGQLASQEPSQVSDLDLSEAARQETDLYIQDIVAWHDQYLNELGTLNTMAGRYLRDLFYLRPSDDALVQKIQKLPLKVHSLKASDAQMQKMATSLAALGDGAAVTIDTSTNWVTYATMTHNVLSTVQTVGGVGALITTGATLATEQGLAACVRFGAKQAAGWVASAAAASLANSILDTIGLDESQKRYLKIGFDLFQTFSFINAARAIPKIGSQCFVAGTKVLAGRDGAGENITRNIQDLREGDVIFSRDQYDVTGELTPHRVVQVFSHSTDHLRLLQIQNPDGNIERLQTTDTHPFWVTGKGWTDAGALQLGDRVAEADGTDDAVVVQSDRVEHPEGITVYNIEVEGDHTYFVEDGAGEADWVWVHNTCEGYHHFVPASLGSRTPYGPKFLTTYFAQDAHTKIHRELAIFLQKKTAATFEGKIINMLARKGNKGEIVRSTFSKEEREAALDEFYSSYEAGRWHSEYVSELSEAKANGWW